MTRRHSTRIPTTGRRPWPYLVAIVIALGAPYRPTAQQAYLLTVVVADGAVLQFPASVAINDAGQVAFVGTPPTSPSGVYRGDGTTLTLLYDPGSPNTQAPPTGAVAINASGTVAFGTYGPAYGSRIVLSDGSAATHVNGPWIVGGVPSLNGVGEFVYGIQSGLDSGIATGAAIVPIARSGDQVPGGILAGASFPIINNAGHVGFLGGLTNGDVFFYRTTSTPGAPVIAVGVSRGGSMMFGMNDDGHIAYLGHPPGGPGSGPLAIYVSDGVTQTPIVVGTADFAPEPHMTPINDSGHVAFVAQNPNLTSSRRLYVAYSGGLWDVLGQGDSIPGLGTVIDFAIGNGSLNGRDQLAVTVRYDDGTGTVKYGVVRADPVDVAPVSGDGAFSTNEDVSLSAVLTASDVHGDPLTFSITSNGTLGTATVTNPATGAFTYVPQPDVYGTDTFTFSVSDGVLSSNVATVTVTIAPVNDAPVGLSETVLAVNGSVLSGALQATDVDGPALSYAVASNAARGTFTLVDAASGTFTYVPPTGGSGSIVVPLASFVDTVTFTASDGSLDSNPATVTFVLRVVDPPRLPDVLLDTREGHAVVGRLQGANLPGGRQRYELVDPGALGRVDIHESGFFRYRPRPGVHGVDRFSVRVRVGSLVSNVAQVTVRIAPGARRRSRY